MAWGLTRSNHAGVDCDHIAAIDNVARKLAYSGKPAALVGLWFSLGHSDDGRAALRHRRDGLVAHPVRASTPSRPRAPS